MQAHRQTILVLVALALAGEMSIAQSPAAAPRPVRKWTVEYVVGSTVGYSAPDAEQALSAAGLNGASPGGCMLGFCSGPTSYPRTSGGGDVQLLMVGYRVQPSVQVRALAAFPGWVGETTGLGSTLNYVTVATRATSFGVLAALDAGGVLWLFGGVSLDHISLERDRARDSKLASGVRPGVWFGGQLRVPGSGRFFVGLTAMRHTTLDLGADPFTVSERNSGVIHTVEGFSAKADYTTIGFGFGVNF